MGPARVYEELAEESLRRTQLLVTSLIRRTPPPANSITFSGPESEHFSGLTFLLRAKDTESFLVVHDADWHPFYLKRYKRTRITPQRFIAQARELGFRRFVVADSLATDALLDGCSVISGTSALSVAIALTAAVQTSLPGRLVGITGSVGKTTLKEMIRQALAGIDPKLRVQNTGLNSNLFFPVLKFTSRAGDFDYSVIEMASGALSQGKNLGYSPTLDVAIVGDITEAHLNKYGTLDRVADVKSMILDAPLAGASTAVIYGGSAYTEMLEQRAKARAWSKILVYGRGEGADIRLLMADVATGKVRCRVLDETVEFHMASVEGGGEHLALNALAVFATFIGLGLDWRLALPALSVFESPAGRGSRSVIELVGGGTATLLDASYNASQSSVKATIQALSQAARPTDKSRKILVLGDMGELAEQAERLHRELIDVLNGADLDVVIFIGANMHKIAGRVSVPSSHAIKPEELLDLLHRELSNGDLLYLKGGNALGLGKVGKQLREGPGK